LLGYFFLPQGRGTKLNLEEMFDMAEKKAP
jgi:hypothetical protein